MKTSLKHLSENPMEEFIIKGDSGLLKIEFHEVYGFPEMTTHIGGYDVKSHLAICSDGFSAKSTVWITTGEIFEFYEKLRDCNELLKGEIYFSNYEGQL
jgi:hypothetical protein